MCNQAAVALARTIIRMISSRPFRPWFVVSGQFLDESHCPFFSGKARDGIPHDFGTPFSWLTKPPESFSACRIYRAGLIVGRGDRQSRAGGVSAGNSSENCIAFDANILKIAFAAIGDASNSPNRQSPLLTPDHNFQSSPIRRSEGAGDRMLAKVRVGDQHFLRHNCKR